MWEPDETDVPDFCRKPTLILGCGNTLFGDDGFGCALVDYLEARGAVPCPLPEVGTGRSSVVA